MKDIIDLIRFTWVWYWYFKDHLEDVMFSIDNEEDLATFCTWFYDVYLWRHGHGLRALFYTNQYLCIVNEAKRRLRKRG